MFHAGSNPRPATGSVMPECLHRASTWLRAGFPTKSSGMTMERTDGVNEKDRPCSRSLRRIYLLALFQLHSIADVDGVYAFNDQTRGDLLPRFHNHDRSEERRV